MLFFHMGATCWGVSNVHLVFGERWPGNVSMGHRKHMFSMDSVWSCDVTSDLSFPFAFGDEEDPVA